MSGILDIDYMVVENIGHPKENRIGDHGRDRDGLAYIFTGKEWKCLEEYRRCAIFWQRKYMELLNEVNRKKRKVKNN